ncbi:MAG: DedA family protein [Chlorobi bacterium]|nr:DedA family protein [Chlorobiota bacterium]
MTELLLAYWQELVALFVASFSSATILPGAAEIVFSHYLTRDIPPTLVILTATVGNTLGSLTNYVLGWMGSPLLHKLVSQKHLQKVEKYVKKYGPISGIMAWLPVVGDAIPAVLGLFKAPPLLTTFWIAVGKLLRFLALYLIYLGVISF